MEKSMERLLYTVAEVAEIFAVKPSTIYSWIHLGRLRVVLTPGGSKRITKSEIERFIPQHTKPESVSKKKMSEATRKTLEKKPDATLAELAKPFGCSAHRCFTR